MTEIKHTKHCEEMTARADAERDRYTADWPLHCRHCEGWGGKVSRYDPSPSGVSLGSGYLEDFEPCQHCTDLGICPRCGSLSLDEDGNHCEKCSYMSEDPARGKHPPYECSCWDVPTIYPDYQDLYDWRGNLLDDGDFETTNDPGC